MTATQIKNAERSGEFTTQQLTVPSGNSANTPGDWDRVPKPKQRLWGLSRTTWIELLDCGKVKGITLRKKHAQRGIRLIYRPSAEAYFKSLMDADGK